MNQTLQGWLFLAGSDFFWKECGEFDGYVISYCEKNYAAMFLFLLTVLLNDKNKDNGRLFAISTPFPFSQP